MMTPARPRPAKKHVAAEWRELLLSEVLPGVDPEGGKRLRRGEGEIYFNARYYDPTTGRFLTEDPSRQGVNWYAYCENDPVNRTDPDGKQSDGTRILTTQGGSIPGITRDSPLYPYSLDMEEVRAKGIDIAVGEAIDIGLSFIPWAGGIKDIYEGARGKNFVTGQDLSVRDRIIVAAGGALSLAIPIAAGKIAQKVSDVAAKSLEKLLVGTARMGVEPAKSAVVQAGKGMFTYPERITKAGEALGYGATAAGAGAAVVPKLSGE